MTYLSSLPAFIQYLGTSLILFLATTFIYVWLTPHAEFKLIREGNLAAACGLSGALLGIALPLASTVVHSISFVDMCIWSVVAMIAQGIVYFLCTRLIPGLTMGIQQGNTAFGLVLASLSLSVGIINAACVS